MIFGVNRFHIFALLTWQFGIFFGTQMIYTIFSGYVPRWRCSQLGVTEFSKNCTVFELCGSQVEYEYDYFHSSALEFDWICGPKKYWKHFYSQLQFIGVLIGTILWGSVSDWIGRKPVSLFVLSFGVVATAASGFAPTWELLLVTRFCIGLCIGGTIVVVCAFVMEMLLPQQRMALRAFFNWGTSRLILTIICYLFPDWRRASYVCALCLLPAPFIVLFIFPESPTWLHTKGRLDDMRKSEMKIARIAGVKYEEVVHDVVVENKNILAIVRDNVLFRRVFVLWMMWFVASICGYTIDLNSSTILGNLFLNQALFSIIIAASKIVLVIYDTCSPSFSRRNLHQYSQAAVCVCFLALSVLVMTHEQGAWILVINLIGTVFIEYTWDACYLCGVESVPTSMRTTVFGSCSFVARLGAVLAPTLAYLNTFWSASAYIMVVALGLLNFVVSRKYLVETKGINLDSVKLHDPVGEERDGDGEAALHMLSSFAAEEEKQRPQGVELPSQEQKQPLTKNYDEEKQ